MEQRTKEDDQENKYRLAMMYLNGLGVERDYGIAEFWLWKALSHKEAPLQLLRIYRNGHGKKRDKAEVINSLEIIVAAQRTMSR